MTNPFIQIYQDLATKSKYVSPRGSLVKEIENYSYTLPAYTRFANFESRKLNIEYIKKEFLWYLRGDKYDKSIIEHAKIWKDMINEDGSIYSNYGQYIFDEINQFDNVVNTLKNDKESRRASIIILSKEHLFHGVMDFPCTYSINFRIRDNYLNMTVRMRSQDAIYGLGNDAPCFSFIHEMMYCTMKAIYPELQYGEYHHSADSFHIYSRHFEMLDKIVAGDKYEHLTIPCISGADEVQYLRNLNFIDIPPNYLFTKWLTQ